MNYFIILVLSFLVVIFQSSFLVHFPIFGYVLNSVLILTIWLTIFRDFKEGLFFAFFSGIFLDFFATDYFGLQAAILIVFVFLFSFFLRFVRLSNWAAFFIFLPSSLILDKTLIKILLWII